MNANARAVQAAARRQQRDQAAPSGSASTYETPQDREAAALLESVTAERMVWRRADQEAQRRLAAEGEQTDDLGALYLDRAGLDKLTSPPALIPGVLPRHAYAVLRGRDQSYKSFVALDWSLSLAVGCMWQGTPTELARVLYIAGEGAWGLRDRVAAWEAHHGVTVPPEALTIRQAALNLHRPGPAFDHLLEHVEAGGYGLVVVDTLRRVSGAADGNSSEMGAVVDNLDRIKQATAAGSVLVVAHTDKGDNDSRGYSGIEDDADVVWAARREATALDLQLMKMKDGPDGYTLRLAAKPVGASLVLTTAVRQVDADPITGAAGTLLATLRHTFPEGAHSGQLRDASGLPSTSYYRALEALRKAGHIRNSGSQQRPFWEATTSGHSQGVPTAESPADLQVSHSVPPNSHEVPPTPTPLRGGRAGVVGVGRADQSPEEGACGGPDDQGAADLATPATPAQRAVLAHVRAAGTAPTRPTTTT